MIQDEPMPPDSGEPKQPDDSGEPKQPDPKPGTLLRWN